MPPALRPCALLLLLGACKAENSLVDIEDGNDEPLADPAPAITVDPERIDFGALPVGESAEEVLTIGNVGDASLDVSDVLLDGGLPFSVAWLGSTVLEAGETVDVAVGWTAGDGPAEDVIRVHSSDAARDTVSVPTTGEGLSPDILVDPIVYDFGVVPVGSVPRHDVLVTNVGAADLHVSGVAWSASSPELSVQEDGGLGAGATLAPGVSVLVKLKYSPDDDLADEGSLRIFSDDPDLPEALLQVSGTGQVAPPSTDHEVIVGLTADDEWEGWMDGASFTGPYAATWTTGDTVTYTLPSGTHVLAVKASDRYALISGFMAAVTVDGAVETVTGDSGWLVATTDPGSGWEDPLFDDSAWVTASDCTDTSPWGSSPAALVATGATWVWGTANCRSLGTVWFRLTIDLP